MSKDGIKIELNGFKELDNMLAKLPDNVADRVLQRSVNKSLRTVLPDIKSKAPKRKGEQSPNSQKYGSLESNLKVKKYRRTKKGQKGARLDTGKAFWAVWLEFGNRHQPATPWLLPAMERNTTKIFAILKDEIGKGIKREIKKLNKGKK